MMEEDWSVGENDRDSREVDERGKSMLAWPEQGYEEMAGFPLKF